MNDLDHQIITTLLGLYLLLSWPVGAVSLARRLARWIEPGNDFLLAAALVIFFCVLGVVSAVYGALLMPYLFLRLFVPRARVAKVAES